ncbi:MAG: hypothetical protein HQM10_07490 [Candidatus Riflebacteria bacterium]|nr:hypothetical protein [Candidatus Riflebacteria bacterium]
MKNRSFLLLTVLLVVMAGSSLWAYGTKDLEQAAYYRDNGSYFAARDIYIRITNDFFTNKEIRREASFFIGFCSVRLNEFWRAILDYQIFLAEFDNENYRFVPVCLYDLGRTYEVVSDLPRARRAYMDCIERFPYDNFAKLSRERLINIPPQLPLEYSSNIPDRITTQRSANSAYSMFTVDTKRVERVNNFINAVQNMENVEETLSNLTEQDKALEIVQKNIQNFKTKTKFEEAHSLN